MALRELRALILSRAQALQAQAAVTEVLSQCQDQTSQALDRERAQSKEKVGKLQAELQRREQTLDQVKQRLLEIQTMTNEMLGPPPSPPTAADENKGPPGQ